MNAVLTLNDLQRFVDIPQLIQAIETGFVCYSDGRSVVPPVGFLQLEDPPGDVHIKYGYINSGAYYVLKVASAFYQNAELNLPVNNGVYLVFSARTGGIEFLLLDEGWLTDIRTAAAGAVAAKYLANDTIDTIGIVGTGVQARLQLKLLRDVVKCQQCVIWGRNPAKTAEMIADLRQDSGIQDWGIEIRQTEDLDALISQSQLIITTTPASEPLIQTELVQKGTHITAVGSDDHGKQELASSLLAKADLLVADSLSQCMDHGECHAGIRDGQIEAHDIIELGDIIKHPVKGRTANDQITIADLTGVAVQDIQVATMVANAYNQSIG